MATNEPDAAAMAEVADGAMSVAQAVAFTGDSRARLYELMDAGVLEWFHSGAHRRITRASAQRYLAALLAQPKEQKRPGRNRKRKRVARRAK